MWTTKQTTAIHRRRQARLKKGTAGFSWDRRKESRQGRLNYSWSSLAVSVQKHLPFLCKTLLGMMFLLNCAVHDVGIVTSAVPSGTSRMVFPVYPAVPFGKLRAGFAGLFSCAPAGAGTTCTTKETTATQQRREAQSKIEPAEHALSRSMGTAVRTHHL
jgi:hypothetical protein